MLSISRFNLPRVYKIASFLFNRDSTITALGTPFLIRSFSVNDATAESSFTVSYLIDSCGFTKERAISLSKKVELKSSSKPDKFLSFFRNHAFPNNSILKIIQHCPRLLLSDVDKTFNPKIKFLRSLGFSDPDLAQLLDRNPHILWNSLEKKTVPCVSFLLSVVHSESNVRTVIKRSPWILNSEPHKRLVPYVAFLQSHGVPNHSIQKLFVYYPDVLTRGKRFEASLREAKRMQLDPTKSAFVRALQVLTSLTKSSWEAKTDIYKTWGWSDEEILSAFRKQPQCMMLSEKKITRCMEFFVNKLGYDSSLIAKNPIFLIFSLEKRTIPRLSVIHALISHNLGGKDLAITTVMRMSGEVFFKRFVMEFEERLPQVLDIYGGKKNTC